VENVNVWKIKTKPRLFLNSLLTPILWLGVCFGSSGTFRTWALGLSSAAIHTLKGSIC
jgi:hypothetical protein